MISLPRAQVQSLVRKLRSHKPYSIAKKKKKKKKFRGLQRVGHNLATEHKIQHIFHSKYYSAMIWSNRLVPNRKRSSSRLYIVTLFI